MSSVSISMGLYFSNNFSFAQVECRYFFFRPKDFLLWAYYSTLPVSLYQSTIHLWIILYVCWQEETRRGERANERTGQQKVEAETSSNNKKCREISKHTWRKDIRINANKTSSQHASANVWWYMVNGGRRWHRTRVGALKLCLKWKRCYKEQWQQRKMSIIISLNAFHRLFVSFLLSHSHSPSVASVIFAIP